MNCTRCEYPLWNLKDRRCPECGLDFAPSQFRFVPGAVRFCCPHCEQEYFGTGADGHLVPRVFDCVTCGAHLHMDEMVLSPAPGSEGNTTITYASWLRNDHRFLARWFRTLGGGMGGPQRLIERIPLDSSVGRAVWFAAFTAMAALFIGLGMLVVIASIASAVGGGSGSLGHMVLAVSIAYFICLGAILVWLLIWILATHLILAMTGTTRGGLRRTAQCLSYASAPNILYAVPCLNFYLWPITALWSTVTGSAMIIRGQQVSPARAIVATAAPPLLLGTGLAALIVAFIVPVFRTGIVMAGNAAAQSVQALQTMRTQLVCTTLNSVAQSNGKYPDHAVELLEPGHLSSGDFELSTSPLAGASQVVGNTTLGAIESLPGPRRTAAIKAIVSAQPPNVIAHRVGDYVFTYHGMQPDAASMLWIFIADPVLVPQSPGAPPPPGFFVGTADGQVQAIAKSGFDAALAKQNEARAVFKLPPLPHPSNVTPSAPAFPPP